MTAENQLTPGDAKLTKVDRNDKKAVLKGAEFKLLDADGKPVKAAGNGKKRFFPLPAALTGFPSASSSLNSAPFNTAFLSLRSTFVSFASPGVN